MADDDYWEVPVLSVVLLQPRTIVLRALAGRVVMNLPPDGVIVPDTQVDVLRAAARTALSVARHQRRSLR